MAEEIIEPIVDVADPAPVESGPVKPKPKPVAEETPVAPLEGLNSVLKFRKDVLEEIENTKITRPWQIVRALGLNMIPVPKLKDIDNPRFAENESNKALADKRLKDATELYKPFMDKVAMDVLGEKGEKINAFLATDQAGNKQVDPEKLETAVDAQNNLYKGGSFSKSYLRNDLLARATNYMLMPDVAYAAQRKLKQLGLSTPQEEKDQAAKIAGSINANSLAQVKTAIAARDKVVNKLGQDYKHTAGELNQWASGMLNAYQGAYYQDEYNRINGLYAQYVSELDKGLRAGELTQEQLLEEKGKAKTMFDESLSQLADTSSKYAREQFEQNDKEGYQGAMSEAYTDYTSRIKKEDKKTKAIQGRIEQENKQKLQTELQSFEARTNQTVSNVYNDAWKEVVNARSAKDKSFRGLVLAPVQAPGGNLGGYAKLFGNSFAESIGGMTANVGKYLESAGLEGGLTSWMVGKGDALSQDYHLYKPEISWQNFYHPSFVSQAVGSAAATTLPALAVGAVTKNPHLAATVATGLEAAANGGETYQQAINKGMDPAEASIAANQAAKASILSFPAQLLESKLFLNALGGAGKGLRKMGAEIALSGGANAAEEAIQTIGQLKAVDPNRPMLDILNDPAVKQAAAAGGLAGGIMQAGALSIGGALGKISDSEAIKGQEAQWLANIVNKHGVNRAKALSEYWLNNNEITEEQHEQLVKKIDGIATKTQEAAALNLTPQQTQATVGLSDDIEEQQQLVNNITSPELKKAAEKTLSEKQKQLDEVVAGTAPLVTISLSSGTSLTMMAEEATSVLKDPEVQEVVKSGDMNVETEDSKVKKAVEEIQAAPVEKTAATTGAEADLSDSEVGLLTSLQNNRDNITGSLGAAINERIEDPFEQKGIVEAVVSQVQDDPDGAVNLFGKDVVDAALQVAAEETAAVAPISQENITEPAKTQEAATTNVEEAEQGALASEEPVTDHSQSDERNGEEKENGLLGQQVQAAFAGGKIKGEVIEEDGDRIKVKDAKGIVYPISKRDVLEEGETAADHYNNERKNFLGQFDNSNPKSDFAILANLKDDAVKTRKLDAMGRKLLRAKQDGIITQEDFDKVSQRVDKMYTQLGAVQRVASQSEVVEVENQVRKALTKELAGVSETEKITNKEKAKEIAANLRKLKRGGKEAYGGLLGIGVAVYDGLVELAATVIEGGGSLADAVQASVEYLKPHLQGEKYKDSEIKNAVVEEFGNIGLIQKPAPRTSIKQDVKAATDTRMQDKVTVKESTILKDTFRRIERISKDVFKAGALAGLEKGKDKGVKQGYGFGVAEGKVIGALEQGKQGKGARALKDALSDYLKETEKSGQLSVRQTRAILNKAENVQTENSLYDFLGYVQKVLANADYQTQLSEAQGVRSKLKKANKSKSFERSAVNKSLFAAFLRINPEQVQDIREYTDMANKILANASGVKVAFNEDGSINEETGEAVRTAGVKNESYQVNNTAIEDYIDAHQEYAEQVAKERLLDVYKDLADAGIIDASAMSLKDMKEIIDAINGTDANVADQAMEALAKQEEKKNALIQLLNYQKRALQGWNQNQEYLELTPAQQQVIDNLDSIDTSQLSLKQLAKLNDVINNIVVNSNFVGAGNISILSQVQKSLPILITKIKASGIELGSIINPIIQGLSSINLMTEFIAKSTKVAAEIQRYTGISGLFDGHAKAKNIHGTALNEYAALKEKMGEGIDNALNRFKRGVYARIIQHFGGNVEEQQQEFERVKTLVRQTADRLLASEEQTEVREGQLVEQVYNTLLQGANSVEDVTSRMDANNKSLVEFWRNKFSEHVARVRESAELYDNSLFEEVENYTGTKRKGLGGKPVANEDFDLFKENYYNKGIDKKAATTKLKRSRSSNLMQGTVLDFDFDSVQSKAFYDTLYDVETSKERAAINMLFDGQQAKQIFGNNKNSKIVADSLSKAVKMQRGKQPPLDILDKAVAGVAKHLQTKAVRMALASLSQLPKQYISVAFNTMVNLGGDLSLYFKALKISNNIELFNQFNIGARGHTQAGYNSDVDLETIERTDFGNNIQKSASWVAETGKKIAEKLMIPLVASDVSVARTSWLAYYMQDLKSRGIDINSRDWKNEHLAPDHEAAAYAEQMVSRSQVANDASAQGNWYKDKRGIKGLVGNTLLPFSTFATNQRLRMTNDMQKILFGGEKKEALKSLAATAAEQAVFNAIKVYALGWLTTHGAHALARAFGMWDDDDEKEYEAKQKLKIKVAGAEINTTSSTKKFLANTLSDYFFSGMGQAPQTLLNKGMNSLYGAVADEETASGRVIEDPKLFYVYDPTKDAKSDYGSWGLYGLPFAKATDLAQSFEPAVFGKTEKVIKGGVKDTQTEKVDLTDKEQAAYLTAFIVDAAALTGVSDADLSALNQKFKRILEDRRAKKYGDDFVLKGKKKGTEAGAGETKQKGIKTGLKAKGLKSR